MESSIAGTLLASGLAVGSLYALMAMGLNIIISTTGVLNFAHTGFFMMGTMVGATLGNSVGLPPLLALAIGMAGGAALAALEEAFAVRPAARLGHGAMGWVLSTLGVGIALQAIAGIWLGSQHRSYPPLLSVGPWRPGGVFISSQQVVIVVALVIVVGGFWGFSRMRVGKALEAVAADREGAAMRGLPVNRLAMTAFAIGGAVTVLAGFLAGPTTGAYPEIGLVWVLKGFVAAALGGIPEVKGAVLGGLVLGVVEAFAGYAFGPGYQNAVLFGILLIVLMTRPLGVFGRQAARLV